MNTDKRLIGIDMDNTLVDFNGAILTYLQNNHPQIYAQRPEEINTFYFRESFPKEHHATIDQIYCAEGFYSSLPWLPGAKEALEYLSNQAHVIIVTAHLPSNPWCMEDKMGFIRRELGVEWEKRVMIGLDKTVFNGDYLIDDAPFIKGVQKPSFEHILFDQPCNQDIKGKRRLNWNNYRAILRI